MKPSQFSNPDRASRNSSTSSWGSPDPARSQFANPDRASRNASKTAELGQFSSLNSLIPIGRVGIISTASALKIRGSWSQFSNPDRASRNIAFYESHSGSTVLSLCLNSLIPIGRVGIQIPGEGQGASGESQFSNPDRASRNKRDFSRWGELHLAVSIL